MNTPMLQQPHNPEAEEAVLGSILIDADALPEVAEIIRPGDFYQPRHNWLYDALLALYGRGVPLDLIAIQQELMSAGRLDDFGGPDCIVTLLNAVPSSLHAAMYAGMVAEAATRRRLIAAAGNIAKAAYDAETPVATALTLAETEVFAAAGASVSGTVKVPRRYMSDYLDAFMADVVATETPRVIRTGITDLDRLLGGLEAGHQYLVAGATSMGKSSFALGVGLDAAMKQGKRVLLFSLEMGEEQVQNRLVSMMTGVAVERLKAHNRRYLSTEEQQRVMTAAAQLSDGSLYIDCTSAIKPADVRTRAARVYAEHGLDMVIVDHMHIMKPNAPVGKQVQDLGAIAMDLADCYKQLGVVGITVAQLNRAVAARAIKTPQLSDLRESGQIEENAYAVLFLHRPAYYEPETENPNVAQVVVAKNRDGATGAIDAYWHPQLAVFRNLSREAMTEAARANGHVRRLA